MHLEVWDEGKSQGHYTDQYPLGRSAVWGEDGRGPVDWGVADAWRGDVACLAEFLPRTGFEPPERRARGQDLLSYGAGQSRWGSETGAARGELLGRSTDRLRSEGGLIKNSGIAQYAIVSDIHANLPALISVLRAIDAEGVNTIVSLGDLVGYYADPNECVQIIRDRAIEGVAGNHDRAAASFKEPTSFSASAERGILWTRRCLTQGNAQFLATLPLFRVVDQRFLIVHGALHPRPNEDAYLTSRAEISKSFDALRRVDPKVNLCFFGHTHRSVAYEYSDGSVSRMDASELILKPGAYYLLNPGSVGQSRDGDPRAAFLIFDADRAAVRFHRVDYDVAACHRKAVEAGLLVEESRCRARVRWVRDPIQAAKKIIARARPAR